MFLTGHGLHHRGASGHGHPRAAASSREDPGGAGGTVQALRQ